MKEPAEILSSHTTIDPVTGCHNWTGALYRSGYGMTKIWIGGERYCRAHRAAYVLAKGAIPDGLQLDHLCRNRRCVNPAHMEAVTAAENNRRSNPNFGKTHCKRGHELTPDNVRLQVRRTWVSRLCITCKRALDEKRRVIA